MYLAVAVLLKLAHGYVTAVAAAPDESCAGDGATVVVTGLHALGTLPASRPQSGSEEDKRKHARNGVSK